MVRARLVDLWRDICHGQARRPCARARGGTGVRSGAHARRPAGLELDWTRDHSRDGRRIDLTPMEYSTLEYLMMHHGTVISKEQLLEQLYDYNWEKFSNVIEVYISALRRKIDAGSHDRLIQTLRGHGYVLRVGDTP